MNNQENKQDFKVPNKVLVVDDLIQHLSFLTNLLEYQNFRVIQATNGEGALELALRELPDLILLDISMPGMDGFEVCKDLKKNSLTKEIPVIFITARTDKEYVVHGLEIGAVDYILKPFNTQELITRIQTQIELKKNRDIITRQNKTLEEKNQQLLELNATKNKFFSIIAHDLKNPFGGSMQLTDLLLADFDFYSEEEKKQMLGVTLNALKQGYGLLENLLEWSRSQIGSISINIKKIQLSPVISEIISQHSNLAQKKEISFSMNFQNSPNIKADEEMFKTIARNLISNAIKFSYPKSTIELSSYTDSSYTYFCIKDSGTGILPQDIPSLFKIDVKYTRLGTLEETGTGLGLILCKEFAEKNNGHIIVDSTPGEGSTFTLQLPK